MPLTYLDPTGDNGSDAYPCVDIRWVMADTSEVHLKLVSKPPPWSCSEPHECVGVDPTEQWIAYGVVTDEDGDGVPDWRYGIDNMPADAADQGPPSRGWRTNLHTGQTEAGPEHGDPVWLNGGGFKSGLPPESADWEPDAIFRFGGAVETTQGSQGWGFELDMPFYTWASVIVNGRVVATDYAPDSGWLVATPGATPGGTFLLGDPYPHLSMTVPDGWTGDEGLLSRVDVAMTLPHRRPRSTCAPSVRFEVIGDPEDRCSDTIKPPLGPSFDDLVTYFAGLPMIEISESADVTVDGYPREAPPVRIGPGVLRSVRLSPRHSSGSSRMSIVPKGACTTCSMDGFNNVWILDVDGVHFLIVSEAA